MGTSPGAEAALVGTEVLSLYATLLGGSTKLPPGAMGHQSCPIPGSSSGKNPPGEGRAERGRIQTQPHPELFGTLSQ